MLFIHVYFLFLLFSFRSTIVHIDRSHYMNIFSSYTAGHILQGETFLLKSIVTLKKVYL